jgi:DNA-binding NarL/FixJ family response regulator
LLEKVDYTFFFTLEGVESANYVKDPYAIPHFDRGRSRIVPEVRMALEKRSEFSIVGEVRDGLQAEENAERLQPDMIVLDINLPGISGFEVARRIRRSCPVTKILFLSQESSPEMIDEALSLGAKGYVVKKRAGIDLIAAVDTVCQGGRFVSEGFGHRPPTF